MDKANYFDNTSYACKHTIKSLYNKIERTQKYTEVIENIIFNAKERDFENNCVIEEMIETFSFFCDSVYSCMDYLGYLIYIYQTRNRICIGEYGKVQSSFHKIINCYVNIDERSKFAIFQSNDLCDVMSSIEQWYYDIRLIRSKETHYSTGTILVQDLDIVYSNYVEYGDHPTVTFNLSNIRMYCDSFVRDIKKIIMLMDSYKIGIVRH